MLLANKLLAIYIADQERKSRSVFACCCRCSATRFHFCFCRLIISLASFFHLFHLSFDVISAMWNRLGALIIIEIKRQRFQDALVILLCLLSRGQHHLSHIQKGTLGFADTHKSVFFQALYSPSFKVDLFFSTSLYLDSLS